MKLFISVSTEELQAINKQNAEDRYVVQNEENSVIVDNRKGLGNTPFNASILYRGCVAFISPDRFLDLCIPLDAAYNKRVASLLKQVLKGKAISSPALFLDVEPYFQYQETGVEPTSPAHVTEHEGRARMGVFKRLGFDSVPVQLFFNYYRARQVKDWTHFSKWLLTSVKSQREPPTTVKKPFSAQHSLIHS